MKPSTGLKDGSLSSALTYFLLVPKFRVLIQFPLSSAGVCSWLLGTEDIRLPVLRVPWPQNCCHLLIDFWGNEQFVAGASLAFSRKSPQAWKVSSEPLKGDCWRKILGRCWPLSAAAPPITVRPASCRRRAQGQGFEPSRGGRLPVNNPGQWAD